MRAAIYARKSNDDNDRCEDNKSISRQVERAEAYIKSKGWTLNKEHIYVDDGISGAEYLKRPGMINLEAHAKEIDIVVTSEISRIGRDMVRNAVVIDDLRYASVRIFYYLTDEEEFADTPEQRLMVSLKSFAAEMEREKTAHRTRDALERKAMMGFSAGGRCYGYDLIPVYQQSVNGDSVRSHTKFSINEEQANVIRSIFKMYADGFGHTVIARTMNGDPRYQKQSIKYFNGVVPKPPEPQTGISKSWGSSCIRAMLYRNRYYGIVEYGKTKKVRKSGSASKRKRCDENIKSVEHEDLRIIEPELWNRVQTRLKSVREKYIRENNGELIGRPDSGRHSKYLLSGLARCGCCGGSFIKFGGQKQIHYYYGCSYSQGRGSTVCSNNLRIKMAELDNAVIASIEQNILTPEICDKAIKRSLELIKQRQKENPDLQSDIKKEIKKIEKELTQFMSVIASGVIPESILTEINSREERLKFLSEEKQRYEKILTKDDLYYPRLRVDGRKKLENFNELLHANIPKGRQVLRKLLRDNKGGFSPIIINPIKNRDDKTFEFRGNTTLGSVLCNDGAEKRT